MVDDPNRLSPTIRPEWDGDAAFLSALFTATHRPMLELSGAPDAMVDQLVAMQFRAQTEGYRTRFPDAQRWVLLDDGGRPVGRVVVAAEAVDLYIVDIAVLPEFQGSGFGGSAVAAVQRAAAAVGLGVRALVLPGNAPSLAMFARRGFARTGREAGASLELRWTASDRWEV